MPRTSSTPVLGPDRAALSRFTEKFKKSFGEESLTAPPRVIVPTGSLELDYALGIGGLLSGRIYETWGPESTAKSTMNLMFARQHQLAFPNKAVAWLDMEQTYEPAWAKAHGIDENQLVVIWPDDAEAVADQVKEVMQSGLFSFLVLDSVGGMVSAKEFEKDAGDAVVAAVAKTVTRMVRMGAVRGRQHQVTLSIVNQVRSAIGSYGADTQSSGGWALRHVTTAKLKNKKIPNSTLFAGGKDSDVVGQGFAVQIEKNKVAPPKRTANMILFNQETEKYGPIGLDRVAEAFTIGKRLGVISQGGGGYYSLADGTRVRGEDDMRAHLREFPDKIETIRTAALESVAHTVVTPEQELAGQEATA